MHREGAQPAEANTVCQWLLFIGVLGNKSVSGEILLRLLHFQRQRFATIACLFREMKIRIDLGGKLSAESVAERITGKRD